MSTPREEKPRGYGPVMRTDDGTEYQATEEDVWNALPCTAAVLIAMAAWDFSSHAEWTVGEKHYYFGSGLRLIVRCLGLAIAAWIFWIVAREARAAEGAAKRELGGRAFVPGKRPGAEP